MCGDAASAANGERAQAPLRIAVVTPMLPVPHDKTRGRYIHETAMSLSALATVRVFFQQLSYPDVPGLRPRSFIEGTVGPEYWLDGIDVEAFTYPAVPGVSRALNGEVAAHVLTPRLRAFAPDLVIGYWVYPDGYAATRAARSLGVPCIVGALGSDIHVRSGLTSALTRRTIRRADALITVSEAMRQRAIETFGAQAHKAHTVVNGFNTEVFHARPRDEARRRLGLGSDERLLIYVGRFVEAKGLRELIEAFRQLAAGDPSLRLALVGSGVMQDELLRAIDALGLRSRTLLPGGLEPAQVAEWITASDVLALPSWSEGYPNVVVEAIACGRPVVATDVGGTREIVDASNGILIAPRDAAALAAALAHALARRWDHAAIAASMRRSWDDVARETLNVAEGLLGRSTSSPIGVPS
jgi:teichuronic acid biosynthesis glycosyltransferase TuaC